MHRIVGVVGLSRLKYDNLLLEKSSNKCKTHLSAAGLNLKPG